MMHNNDIRSIKKAIIKICPECNNNCLFCHAGQKRCNARTDEGSIVKKIDSLGSTIGMVVLSGGEPTISKCFPSVVRHIHKRGLLLGLVTNARTLCNIKLAAYLKQKGLSYVYASLHSHDGKTHNFLTRSNSFQQSIGGIRNCISLGIYTQVNCVVNAKNMHALNEYVNMAVRNGIPNIKFSPALFEGLAVKNQWLIPKKSDCALQVMNAISYAKARGVHAATDCFEECLIQGYEGNIDNLMTNNMLWMSEADEDRFYQTDCGKRSHYECCIECSLRDRCSGVYDRYAELRGISEFRPVIRKVPNSFNYFASGTYKGNRLLAYNEIQVKHENRLYRTETHDFSVHAISRIAREGQIYKCNGISAPSKDFSADYTKLSDTRGKGITAFKRHELVMKNIIGKLQGSTLEIGCGNVRYIDLVLRLVEKGRISYTGIDSNKGSISFAESRIKAIEQEMRIKLFAKGFEEFSPGEKYQNILFISSFNHIAGSISALKKCVSMLLPGGQIIISDNSPFAVVAEHGSKEIPAKVGSRFAFEHFHNYYPEDVDAIGRICRLEIIKRTRVTKASSNQWTVMLRKPGKKRGSKE